MSCSAKEPRCDCGKKATSKDGSGYSCTECKAAVKAAQDDLHKHIINIRNYGESLEARDDRRASDRARWHRRKAA